MFKPPWSLKIFYSFTDLLTFLHEEFIKTDNLGLCLKVIDSIEFRQFGNYLDYSVGYYLYPYVDCKQLTLF